MTKIDIKLIADLLSNYEKSGSAGFGCRREEKLDGYCNFEY